VENVGSDVVDEAIDEALIEVTNDYGDPPKKSTFFLMSNQYQYEYAIDNKKTYAIERVFIRDDENDRMEYTEDETPSESSKTYSQSAEFNTITFSSDTISTWAGRRVEVHYVPQSIHHLVRTKAALFLLDRVNVANAEENTPSLGLRLVQRIGRIEESLKPFMVVGSEDEINYDPTYGDVIPQRRFRIY